MKTERRASHELGRRVRSGKIRRWIAGVGLLIGGAETAAVWGTPELPEVAPLSTLTSESSEGDGPYAPAERTTASQMTALQDGFAALAQRPDAQCRVAFVEPWVPAKSGGAAGERVMECVRRLPRLTDKRVPLDQRYDLTTFGGPGDEQPTYCEDAPDADGTWFYAANAHRFTCGQRVRLVDGARTRCVIVQVADLGPHLCVEAAGRRPAWDVSPLAARHLYGVRSSGWSEHREVFGAPVAPGNPLGPCGLAPSGPERGSFIGGACRSDADCAIDGGRCLLDPEGWPGGHCTRACMDTCPDRDGPYPMSACTELPGGAAGCMARCDFTLFESGCRTGYTCSSQPTRSGQEQVCLPAGRCE